jgi:hypothetical protein
VVLLANTSLKFEKICNVYSSRQAAILLLLSYRESKSGRTMEKTHKNCLWLYHHTFHKIHISLALLFRSDVSITLAVPAV